MGTRTNRGITRAISALFAAVLIPVVAAPVSARQLGEPARGATGLDVRIQKLAERQREMLGMPKQFFPFLDDEADDARVVTGHYRWGDPAPDLTNDNSDDVLETDLRYRYEIGGGQDPLQTIEAQANTRITLRNGKNGEKVWRKRFPRDAYPFSMRVGKKGRHGVVIISGSWNFYATTEESTLQFDAFTRKGKHLWTRKYQSISYYDLLTYITKDALMVAATFDGIKGRADDLLIGLATTVQAGLTTTTSVRTLTIDGRDGSESVHPIIDIGIDWWPIPLPTKDLDGDGLDDFATTNKFGVDPGDPDAQEGPSLGGTVYTRKGTTGLPIWTTSGLRMEIWAMTERLPDVVGDRSPDVGLSTYVSRKETIELPIDLSVAFFNFYPRVYLLEGNFGAEQWHKKSDWIYTPGDINGGTKPDLMLGSYRTMWRKNKSVLKQLAVDGYGHRLWQKRSTWHYDTMPCPRGICDGWSWGWLDWSPNYQPDRVRDSLLNQYVEQNRLTDDRNVRAFNGRDGRIMWQDNSEWSIQTAGTAIDGRGSDLMAFKFGGIGDKARVEARDGWNRTLWSGMLGGRDGLIPRRSGFYAMGFELSGDRCGDLVINGWERDESFYGVFEGSTGRMRWSSWTGSKADRPRMTNRVDRSRTC